MVTRKQSLEKLFIDSLKDIYDAEHQVMEALPKMAKATGSADLRKGLESHLTQTRGQVDRLTKVFEVWLRGASRTVGTVEVPITGMTVVPVHESDPLSLTVLGQSAG